MAKNELELIDSLLFAAKRHIKSKYAVVSFNEIGCRKFYNKYKYPNSLCLVAYINRKYRLEIKINPGYILIIIIIRIGGKSVRKNGEIYLSDFDETKLTQTIDKAIRYIMSKCGENNNKTDNDKSRNNP